MDPAEPELQRAPRWRRAIPPVVSFALGLGAWPAVEVMGTGVVETIVYWSLAFAVLLVATIYANPGEDWPIVAALGWLLEAVVVTFCSVALVFALAFDDGLLCSNNPPPDKGGDCF